jgi:hypothetical protein
VDENFSFDVLDDGSLILTIDERCIKTVAARAYRELAQVVLDERLSNALASDDRLGCALDVIAEFLNTEDFAHLRATYPKLAGGTPCRVRVYRAPDGKVRWVFE